MAADEDLADVEKVLAGEIAAFERIVHRWQSPLVNLAYRFCRDRARAEEMAQEAFLRAYRALGTWRRDAAFSTWLFALATNLYRADGGLENEDRDRAVCQAVFALPAKYPEALTLFYFHEMNVQVAARSLGLPEGTVKARLARGREMLRGKLPRLLTGPRLKEVL